MNTPDYYDSALEMVREDNIVETDVQVRGWDKQIRIRALTFSQQNAINKQADDGNGGLDHALWVYWTIVHGVVRPRFTIETAKLLADSNGTAVKALADRIWELGRISKSDWDAFIKEQERLAQAETDAVAKMEPTDE